MKMNTVTRALAAVAGVALLAATPIAQTPQQPSSPPSQQTIQQQNEEMIKELRAIRQLLERLTQPQPSAPPQPQRGRVSNTKGYMLGKPDAPLTMVEFTDLQCPYCRQFALTAFDEIKKNWIDTGKLRYISRDFPLDFHAQAMNAARAARCAGEQGKFWELRMTLMRNANLLTPDYITKSAADLKLDMKAYTACAASSKYDAEIQAEMAEGTQIGITGTPTFILGPTTASGVEGPILVGALPYASFDAKLKDLLDSVEKK